jgi:P4 family phage/plasmid primase-like protien
VRSLRQWINWRLEDRGESKPAKVPVDFTTGQRIDPHDSRYWLPYELAAAFDAQHVGFVLTTNDPYFCIDVDHSLVNGAWSPLALDTFARFAGAYMEVSYSGDGAHVMGQGVPPAGYLTRGLAPHVVELYAHSRFIAITGNGAMGSPEVECSAALAAWCAQYMKPMGTELALPGMVWTTGPCEGATPIPDDQVLISKMLHARPSAGVAFGGKASAADLWAGKVEALAAAWPSATDDYDRSAADGALAAHLAFWTGRDCSRIERLMKMSALVRPKWEREDYLRRTIAGAAARTQRVYTGPQATILPLGNVGDDQGVNLGFAGSPEVVGLVASRAARLLRLKGEWLTFEPGGFYREIDEEIIRREIRAVSPVGLTSSKVTNILDELKAASVVDGHGVELPFWLGTMAADMPRAADLIVCKNGILDPVTSHLYAHSDSLLTFNALPYAYDPSAPAPRHFLKFLDEVFDADVDSIHELQKMFGYVATLDTSRQKIFAIIGPTRSGKGTIGRVLEALIGKQNCCGPSFAKISGDFGLQSFIGKQLAIIADARLGHRTDKVLVAERLLSISGEDSLDIARKNRTDWYGRLSARLLILSNELPALPDPSGSLAARFVAFSTPNSFLGREDRQLTNRLLGELPSILNWSLEGLRHIQAGAEIVTPSAAHDLIEGIEALGSPVKAFVVDRCTVTPGGFVPKDQLWITYCEWCRSNGIPGAPLSKEMFSRAIKTAFAGAIKDHRPRVSDSGQRPRYWSGIAFAEPASPPINCSGPNPPFGPGLVQSWSR